MIPNFAHRIQQTSQSGLDAIVPTYFPDSISFAGGFPDERTFPTAELAASFQAAVTDHPENLWQYHDCAGDVNLRSELADWLTTEKWAVSPENILITQGSQQALSLIAALLLNPGDGVLVEAPTYIGALAAFDVYEPVYYEAPMQADGLDLTAVEALLAQHTIKMIYLVPHFQNPTGNVLSLAKRQRLLELAHRYQVIILEDDPYRPLRFAGEPLPTLASLDHEGLVISLGSFSKILAPSVRLGWVIASEAVLTELINLKRLTDIETPMPLQATVAHYLKHDDFTEHLEHLRHHYQEKCTTMIQALDTYLPPEFHHTRPEGGFFLWLEGPTDFDTTAFLNNVLMPKAHVHYVPGVNLYAHKDHHNGARISYSQPSVDQIVTGIKRMAQCLNA